MALSLIMVLCLLVYRLAEYRLPVSSGGDRADNSRPGAETHGPPDDALGLPMF